MSLQETEYFQMTTKEESKQKLKELKPLLFQKYHITKIGIFGSYAENRATPNSDIDILVVFQKAVGWEFFDVQDLLEKQLQHKVDLVSIKALKQQLKESILQKTIFV